LTVLHHLLDGPDDAPVLVLSNSMGATLEMWDPQVPALAEQLRVVRYDHPGHGGSTVDAATGSASIDDLGTQVLTFLDNLEVDRFSFCGLSLGGMVGMWLAVNAPERLDRLVLCATSANAGAPQGFLDRAKAVRAGGVEVLGDGALGMWFTPGYVQEHPEAEVLFWRMRGQLQAEGYAQACEAAAGFDFQDRLAEITAPTLVLAGANDLAITEEHATALQRGIPGAKLVVVPDSAHLLNIEQPDTVSELILDHVLVPDVATPVR
jgi:3-oxoadipate enol-lactonase